MASFKGLDEILPAEYLVRNLGVMNPIVFWGEDERAYLANNVYSQFLHFAPHARRISMTEFIALYTDAIRWARVHQFRKYIRSFKLIVIYDIDIIRLSDLGQKEFYHFLKHMLDHERQVILTSREHPTKLGLIEEVESLCICGLVERVELRE